jgi:hypothetical protein
LSIALRFFDTRLVCGLIVPKHPPGPPMTLDKMEQESANVDRS